MSDKIINYIRIQNIKNDTTLCDYLRENYTREQLLEIKKINSANKHITEIGGDLSELCPDLEYLIALETSIKFSDISRCSKLLIIELHGMTNDICEFDFSIFENLIKILIISSTMTNLNIENNNIKYIEIIESDITNNKLSINCEKIQTLIVSNCYLKNIELNNCPDLRELNVCENKLEKLNLEECPNINKLNISGNEFHSLENISGLYSLENLCAIDVRGNTLSAPIYMLNDTFPKLKYLLISGEQDPILNKIMTDPDAHIDDYDYIELDNSDNNQDQYNHQYSNVIDAINDKYYSGKTQKTKYKPKILPTIVEDETNNE
jgi:hypothetical protein